MLRYPSDHVIQVGAIDPKYDRVYKASSRSISGKHYEVNVAQLTCSCSEFRGRRAEHPIGDVRRVCAHLYDKLYQTKVEQGFEPVVQLIIRFARSCQSFHRVNAADADIVFGFSSGHPWVRVLAIFGNVRSPNRFDENVIAASYDVEKGRWPDLEDYIVSNFVPV